MKHSFYVTFTETFAFREDRKIAVECSTIDKAYEVAQDACSISGVKYVRIRKCGKPKGREIISYYGYFDAIVMQSSNTF